MTRISNGSAMMTSSFIEGDLKWKLSALDVAKHWKFHVILRVDAIFNALCAVVDFHLWEDGSFLYLGIINSLSCSNLSCSSKREPSVGERLMQHTHTSIWRAE